MKILPTLTFACLVALTAFGAGTVPVTIGWTDPNTPPATLAYVYTNSAPDTGGTLCMTVTNATTATLTLQRPSSQYIYVTLGDVNSSPTNYVAPSEPSNIIRVRVLGNGQIRVN